MRMCIASEREKSVAVGKDSPDSAYRLLTVEERKALTDKRRHQ